MRVTKWGECGILCALYLAQRYDDSTVGASDIAENQGLDLQYTQQILHRLRKGNVIESVRGPKGGYRLVRAPEKTTLKEILYAAEGDTFQIICDYAPIHPNDASPNQCATKETCSLHGVWQDLRTAIDALLEQKTLADLLIQPQEGDSLVQLGKRESAPIPSKV
jgi:Rrf2 family iron-sulfur cluster assembly transcriptional regulator